MILKGLRGGGEDDDDEEGFYDAINRFGAHPDPARLSAALAKTSIIEMVEGVTEPPLKIPGHYSKYLDLNPEPAVLIRAALEVASATGDQFGLRVVSDGPVVEVTVDESHVIVSLRRLPSDPPGSDEP